MRAEQKVVLQDGENGEPCGEDSHLDAKSDDFLFCLLGLLFEALAALEVRRERIEHIANEKEEGGKASSDECGEDPSQVNPQLLGGRGERE